VPQDVANAPVCVPQGFEKAVVSSDNHTHKIAVGALRQVEDPAKPRSERLTRREDGLLATEQTVEGLAREATSTRYQRELTGVVAALGSSYAGESMNRRRARDASESRRSWSSSPVMKLAAKADWRRRRKVS
jgi:hypothetical protein